MIQTASITQAFEDAEGGSVDMLDVTPSLIISQLLRDSMASKYLLYNSSSNDIK